jgi:hypothetical protein
MYLNILKRCSTGDKSQKTCKSCQGRISNSGASGQKQGGFETWLEGAPMCVALLTERGHPVPCHPNAASQHLIFFKKGRVI